MAEQLTSQQKMAVENRGGKLLVSAAAGSGKTKVLVDRLLLYLTDPASPANLDEFLIITYTKAAASELRGKIAAKLTERIAQEPENRHLQKQLQRLYLTQISTVHSFCSNVLREYAYRLDIPADFRVAEETECRELQDAVLQELLDRCYREQAENDNFTAFVDTQGLGRDDRQIPELIIKVYNSARCHMDPGKWLDDCLREVRTEGITDAGQTIWGRYLMEELQSWLDGQIAVIQQCAAELSASPRLEKTAALFDGLLIQLQMLRSAESWDQIYARREIVFERWSAPKKDCDKDLLERTKAARDACKAGLEKKLACFSNDSEQVLKDLRQTGAAAAGLIDLVRQFVVEYQQVKKNRRIMDFGDLEHRMLDLLLGKNRNGITSAALEIGKRFREILVDEYQDSNEVQDAIFTALTMQRQNCFMVGDVKQSIYQFRLAEPQIFLDKYNSYAPAESAKPGEGRRILLSDNFRSGGEVIEGVNDVFRRCMSRRTGGLDYGDAEALREGFPHVPLGEPGVELYVLETAEETYAEEAAFVAERIQTMLREKTPVRDGDKLRPVTAGDIVILLRSAKNVAAEYQNALEKRGIRCNAGDSDLLKCQEIAVLRSLLQTVANPRQDIPLVSVLASPVFGFTANDLAQFRSGHKKCTMYDALLQSDLPKAKEFLRVLETLRREARMNTLSELLERCFSLTRMDSIYGAMTGGEVKKANLQQFYRMASDYEKTGLRGLNPFLEHLDAAEEKGLKSESGKTTDSVTLMTVHSSKGLEFPVVFLCGLARKFNTENSREQILCDKTLYLGLKAVDNEKRFRYPSISHRAISAKTAADGVSEEMRVLYVAMTRARDRLIMTYAGKNPEKTLKDMALRYPFDQGRMICRDAGCPGNWVLLSALQHTEAAELRARVGAISETTMGMYPWKIVLTQAAPADDRTERREIEETALPEEAIDAIRRGLHFQYPHAAATQAPSKQTATGRKGRFRDTEAAENAREPKTAVRVWRKPAFFSGKTDGRAYGNAMHCAMQYIRYENCGTAENVHKEISRLAEEGYLTEEQAEMVNREQIAAFFSTEIGQMLCAGADCLREFKFSILDDGSHYGEGLEGEQVLLQGVVDCALLEKDGITVLDFKTDHVTDATAADAAERYRPQVQTYSEALSRIYRMPIKKASLYFFRLGKFFDL